MDPYYHCIKYRNPADKNIDGTDSFMIVESMKLFEKIHFELRDDNSRVRHNVRFAVARNHFSAT